jgi:uncharacterized RDD family membrane protein YckC
MAAPSGPRASFFRRLVALLLDGIVLGIVEGIVRALLGQSLGAAVAVVLGIAYYTYFEGSPSGQTVGKRALGIRVVDLDGGGPIGYMRALFRWLGRILSTIVFLLGYFWMLWDPEKQTWHDKIAGSVVVPSSAYPVASWPGSHDQAAPTPSSLGEGPQPPASTSSVESLEEEQARKFDEREKQWGRDS